MVLAVFSIFAGFLNAPKLFGGEWFGRLVEDATFVHAQIPIHDFSVTAALLSMAVVTGSIAVAALLYFGQRLPKGVTERVAPARIGYGFLDRVVGLQVDRPGRHRRHRERQRTRGRGPRRFAAPAPDRSRPAVRLAALRRDGALRPRPHPSRR
jgi:hypothetical protein